MTRLGDEVGHAMASMAQTSPMGIMARWQNPGKPAERGFPNSTVNGFVPVQLYMAE